MFALFERPLLLERSLDLDRFLLFFFFFFFFLLRLLELEVLFEEIPDEAEALLARLLDLLPLAVAFASSSFPFPLPFTFPLKPPIPVKPLKTGRVPFPIGGPLSPLTILKPVPPAGLGPAGLGPHGGAGAAAPATQPALPVGGKTLPPIICCEVP